MSLFDSERDKTERQKWLDERKKGVGGSEIAIILGASRFSTVYKLWLEKTGQVPVEDISGLPHVQRGVSGEKLCRTLLEQRLNRTYKPKSWQIEGTIFRGSDDGYCLDINQVLEIKCMGRKDHDAVKEQGIIPAYYLLQCQWVLMVSGAESCRFISFVPETQEMVEVIVLPKPEEWEEMKQAALKFWQHVEDGTPPKLTDRDYKTIQNDAFDHLSESYIAARVARDNASEIMAEIEPMIKAYTKDHPAITNNKIRVLRSKRKGTIDYGALAKDSGADVEKYRKPASDVCTIHVL